MFFGLEPIRGADIAFQVVSPTMDKNTRIKSDI